MPPPTRRALRVKRRANRERFAQVRRAEKAYARKLRGVARQVGLIVEGFAPKGVVRQQSALTHALRKYSELIRPWAHETAQSMIDEVNLRDAKAWQQHSREMGRAIRREALTAPTGDYMRLLLQENVDLITSLPTKAAERVHALTIEALSDSSRAGTIAKEIMRSGHVTESRAMLIARTESARTATAMTEARASYVGSEGYFWRSVGDSDVRELHRKLNGRYFRWDDPPVAGEKGEKSHPGSIYNCFPGNTLAGPIDRTMRVFRAKYSGPLVVLNNGKSVFEATPNHPILTPFGWVAAKDIQVGDEVLAVFGKNARPIVQNMDKRFAPLEEIFETACANGEAERTAGAVINLYGDIVDDKVDVIRTEFYLSLKRNIGVFEQFRNSVITKANRRVSAVRYFGGGAQIGKSLPPRLFDMCFAFLFGKLSHSDLIGLGNVAGLQSVFQNSQAYRSPIATQAQRQGQFAFLRGMTKSDRFKKLRIVDKGTREFKGHVFSLETIDGAFSITPVGVITKNCRCYPEPVLPDELE